MSREMRRPNVDLPPEAPPPGEPADPVGPIDPIDPGPADPQPIPSPDGDPQPRSPGREPDPPPIGDHGPTEPMTIAAKVQQAASLLRASGVELAESLQQAGCLFHYEVDLLTANSAPT